MSISSNAALDESWELSHSEGYFSGDFVGSNDGWSNSIHANGVYSSEDDNSLDYDYQNTDYGEVMAEPDLSLEHDQECTQITSLEESSAEAEEEYWNTGVKTIVAAVEEQDDPLWVQPTPEEETPIEEFPFRLTEDTITDDWRRMIAAVLHKYTILHNANMRADFANAGLDLSPNYKSSVSTPEDIVQSWPLKRMEKLLGCYRQLVLSIQEVKHTTGTCADGIEWHNHFSLAGTMMDFVLGINEQGGWDSREDVEARIWRDMAAENWENAAVQIGW